MEEEEEVGKSPWILNNETQVIEEEDGKEVKISRDFWTYRLCGKGF